MLWNLLCFMAPTKFLQWVGGSGRIFLEGGFISSPWSFCARAYGTFQCLFACPGRISMAARGSGPQLFRPGLRPGRGFHSQARWLFLHKLAILTPTLHGKCWMQSIVLNLGRQVHWILLNTWIEEGLSLAAARALEGARRMLLTAHGAPNSTLGLALLACFLPGVMLLLILGGLVTLGGTLVHHCMLAQDSNLGQQLTDTVCHCPLRTIFRTAFEIGLEVKQRLQQRTLSNRLLVPEHHHLLTLRLVLMLPQLLMNLTLLLRLRGQHQGPSPPRLRTRPAARQKQLDRQHHLRLDGLDRALADAHGDDLAGAVGDEVRPGAAPGAQAEHDSGQEQMQQMRLTRPLRQDLHRLHLRQLTWSFLRSPVMIRGTPRIYPGWPRQGQLRKSYVRTGARRHRLLQQPLQIHWTAFLKLLREGKRRLTLMATTLLPRTSDLAAFPHRGLLLPVSAICLVMMELATALNPKTEAHSLELGKFSVPCIAGLCHCLLWLCLSAIPLWQVMTTRPSAGPRLSGWLGDVMGRNFYQRQHPTIHRSMQPNMMNTTSRLGPKSQARRRAIAKAWRGNVWLLYWVFLFSTLHVGLAARDVRVSNSPTELLGAVSTDSAKHRGPSRSSFNAASLPTARKRSYRRAVQRAMKNGSTQYRGKTFTCSELQQLNFSSSSHIVRHKTSPSSKRIRTLSINFDGMTSAIYDTLALWMSTAPYDVLLMQELHRGFGDTASEWEAAGWYIVSSPDPGSRFAGVAIAIRKSLVKDGIIRFAEVVPGRLLHVRVSGKHYGIDLLSCYQHVISSRESRSSTSSKRDTIWTALGRCLSSMPRRNILLLGGDFNCSAVAQAGLAGSSSPAASDYYFDQDELMSLAQAHGLCFLNTWTRCRDSSMQTFLNGVHSSQIDYLLTRSSQADSIAKQARPVPSLDFSPWRLGARHAPVQASTPMKPGWLATQPRKPSTDAYDKVALEDSLHAKDQRSHTLLDRVRQAAANLQTCTAESLNQLLLRECETVYPTRQKHKELRPWQQEPVQLAVRAMWRQRQALRRVGHEVRLCLYSVRHVLYAFRAWALFQRSYRELRRQGKHQRKQLLINKLQQASQAAARKDIRALYQTIKLISPKQQRGKVRIRTVDGELLEPQTEHAEISDYFHSLFGTDQPDIIPTDRLQPVVFEKEELEASLQQLGTGRAVPRGHAPSSAWKHCRQVLSGPLLEAVHTETAAGFPSWWADCSLALIPKPAKTIKRPESLRPLGIQDAAGKAVARVIKTRLYEQIRARLEQYPQFAYLQSRSTADAIQRVTAHCTAIRSQLKADRFTVHRRRQGTRRARFTGGAQLTLDMTTAFDKLPRQSLADSLAWANVDDNLASLILDVHLACRYRVEHEGYSTLIDMKNGVRQGCTLAPLLWALFSVFLLSSIEQQLGDTTWVRQGMTLFADDTHCAWQLQSQRDLRFMQQSLNVIFQVYRRHGMIINETKSAFIIRLGGTHGSKWLKDRVRLVDGKRVVCLSHGLDSVEVPLVKQVKYLGIIVSYHDFETASVKHRLQSAGLSRQRLAKILHSSRYLTLQQRLQIYQVCIRSTLLYGVSCFKLPDKAIALLHRRDIKYIRAIAKSPVHITRESTQDLLQRLQFRSLGQCLQAYYSKLGISVNTDVLEPHLRATGCSASRALQELPSSTRSYACPTCGVHFPSQQIMRIHHARKHGFSLRSTSARTALSGAALALHSKDEVPVCKYCSRSFTGWQEFRYHLQHVCEAVCSDSLRLVEQTLGSLVKPEPPAASFIAEECPTVEAETLGSALQSAAGPQQQSSPTEHAQPLCQRRDLQKAIQAPNWYLAFRLPGVLSRLKHHCVFCDRWLSDRSGSLENHLKAYHPEVYCRQKDVRSMCRTTSIVKFSPCEACGSCFSASSKHQCTIMQHLGYLRVATGSAGTSASLNFAVIGGHDSSSGTSADVQGHSGHGGGWGPEARRGGGEQPLEVPETLLKRAGHGQRPSQQLDGGSDTGGWKQPPDLTGLPRQAGAVCSPEPAEGSRPGMGARSIMGWLALQGMVKHQRGGEQPPRGPGGENATAGQGGSSPRGRAQPDADGEGLRLDLRDQAGLRSESPVRAGGYLAREEGEGGGQQPTQADALHGAPRALETSAPSSGVRPEPPRPYGGERIGHPGGGNPGAQVGIPEVELHLGEVGGRPRCRAHAAVAGCGNADSAGGHDPGTQCPGAVSCDSEAHREPRGRHHHLSDGSGASGPNGLPSLGNDDEPLRPQRGSPHRASDQASSDGPAADCEGPCREIPPSEGQGQRSRPPRAESSCRLGIPHGLRLVNRSNLCYLNATCNLLYWMRQVLGTDQAYGPLRRAMLSLSTSGRVYVPSHIPWTALLQHWPHLHSQQDAAEFVAFLFRSSMPAAYQGCWESRLLSEVPHPQVTVMDSGTLATPLQFALAGASLQHCAYSWHTQTYVHALSDPPDLLLLHLKRFQTDAVTGVCAKNSSWLAIQAGEVVRLHCFHNAVDTSTYILNNIVFWGSFTTLGPISRLDTTSQH